MLYFDSLIDSAAVAMRCGDDDTVSALLQRMHEGYEKASAAAAVNREPNRLTTCTHSPVMLGQFKDLTDLFRESKRKFTGP